MVDGLLAWERERLADTLVLLPSRRACLAAREAFRRAAGGQPLLLPRLVPIGEPDEGELALDGAIELSLPPAIGPIRRRLLLTRLIRARDPTMAHEQAVRLAAELARFLDELHNEEVALDRLDGLAPETLAEHWQESLVFLRLLARRLAGDPGRRGATRRRACAGACCWMRSRQNGAAPHRPCRWLRPASPAPSRRSPGCWASSPACLAVRWSCTRWTRDWTRPAWEQVGPSHPQFGLKRLLAADRRGPGCRPAVARDAGAPGPAHGAVVGGASARPKRPMPGVTSGRSWLPAPRASSWTQHPTLPPRPSASPCGCAEALETPGKRATLVTTSRGLGRRVAAELLRWGVRVDDSAGVPLDQSPPGSFLLLTAQLATPDASPVQLLAALKHPLAAGGIERAEFRRRVRALERLALRGIRPAGGLHGLGGRAAGRRRAGGPPRLARRPSQQRRGRSPT